jgi:hypothetical protein
VGIGSRLSHAWNAFNGSQQVTQPEPFSPAGLGASYGVRPDRFRPRFYNDRTIVRSIYTRMAIDVASADIRHVRLDDKKRYIEDIESGLQNCLTVEANLDQAAFPFMLDAVMTLFEEGVIAIVPIDTSLSPLETGGYDILNLRVGLITQWYPEHVKVDVYNEKTGRRQEIICRKRDVAIIENPLYSVMNEPNSTLQRLIRKLGLLDMVDEQSASGKLDMIIQLPYVIKTEARRVEAEKRRTDIEAQLRGSQYGIAYTDGTEKITQLNRPAENNLMKQVETLTAMLYGELGITADVMNGTATEETMLNYNNRTIKPILTAIVGEMRRKFLTKTARTQKQSVMFFNDPFKLVPLSAIAEIADKLARNEILSSNELRQILGFAPVADPKADELRNSNMPQAATESGETPEGEAPADDDLDGVLDDVDSTMDEMIASLEADLANA